MRIFKVLLSICILCIAACSISWCDDNTASASGIQTPPPPETVATAKPSNPGHPYTSVIIDTTGLKLDRCMSPKIRRVDGSEVWGTVKVDIDFVEDHGIVAYAGSLEEAKKNGRCGDNPMIIKAFARAGGNFRSDPVISNPDASLLLDEDKKGGFLSKFNVIFVKDN